MDWKRILIRRWFHFCIGYSTYLSFSMSLLGYFSAISYFTVKSIPLPEVLFPDIQRFVFFALVVVLPLGILFGCFHYKRSPFYETKQTIGIESNPYPTERLPPIQVAAWKLYLELSRNKRLSNIANEIDRIIRRSEQ